MSYDGSGVVSLGKSTATGVHIGSATVPVTVDGSTIAIGSLATGVTPTVCDINTNRVTFTDSIVTFGSVPVGGGPPTGSATFNAPATFEELATFKGSVDFDGATVTGLPQTNIVSVVKTIAVANSDAQIPLFAVTFASDSNVLSSHTINWQCAEYTAGDVLTGAVSGTSTILVAYVGTDANPSFEVATASTAVIGATDQFNPRFTLIKQSETLTYICIQILFISHHATVHATLTSANTSIVVAAAT